jgi:hypothetical protein
MVSKHIKSWNEATKPFKEVAKKFFKSESELTDYAKKELAKARKEKKRSYISQEELMNKILNK